MITVDFQGYTGVHVRREFNTPAQAWEWAWERYLWKAFFQSIADGVDGVCGTEQ